MKTDVRDWASTGSSPTTPRKAVTDETLSRKNVWADKGGQEHS